MKQYSVEYSDPKTNAQRNLEGRTHYVDSETLRFHKSRILTTHVTDCGLIFSIVESVALDMHNTKRGYRSVTFDLFGNVINRASLEDCKSTKKAALNAMWDFLKTVNGIAVTKAGIERADKQHKYEMDEVRKMLKDVVKR